MSERKQKMDFSSNKKYILADLILWKHLNGKKILRCHFQRHVTVEGQNVNYLCDECKVVILLSTELSGIVHLKEAESRLLLESKGYSVLIFNYEKIISNAEAVIEELKIFLAEKCR